MSNDKSWETLGYPEVPKWLTLIKSHDQIERDKGYTLLSENLFDEPNVNSIKIIPAYIELLQKTSIPEKDGILNFLHRLISYSLTYLGNKSNESIAHEVIDNINKGKDVFVRLSNDSQDDDVKTLAIVIIQKLEMYEKYYT